MGEKVPLVVVGAGPAGLAASHELTGLGIEHVVLERGRVAQTWRERWDSFCLVTPNWTVQLPGRGTYAGAEPDGFMPKDDIVAHFEQYATGFEAPVREGIDVTSLRAANGGFLLETTQGEIEAGKVVLATGAFQKPHRPPGAGTIPENIMSIDATQYTNPDALPAGRVLVVGSGQTGCQIAEDLHGAGREVVVACGKAPWGPRRIEDRDIVAWVIETPFMEQKLADLPSPLARLAANFQVTGRDGGHDLNYRTLVRDGVTLAGRLVSADERVMRFAPDLEESVAWGDARYGDIRNLLTHTAEARGLKPPKVPDPEPFKADAPEEIDTREVSAVIFTAGFRPDYTSWIAHPDAFDEFGFPIQTDGASTVVPGLYFVGTHFLRKRKSSTLLGMAEDATVIARRIAGRDH